MAAMARKRPARPGWAPGFVVLVGALLAGTGGPAQAQAQSYTLDPAHSWVQFELLHFGTSTMRGRFGPAAGNVTLDRTAGRGELGITIPMDSINTGIAPFDAHLRSADLLGTTEYPTAWFVSRQLSFEGGQLKSMRGELSWRGISQPMTLKAVRFGCYTHPRLQREVCGGDFEGELVRSSFGVGYGLPFVADKVTLRVQVEGIRAE